MGPPTGSTLVIDGPKRTVKLAAAGVGSSFPARSRAFTSKVWLPSGRPVSVAVVAGLKRVHAPPSSRQAKRRSVTGGRLSVPLKPSVRVAVFTSPGGALVIAVSGGVLSTITTRVVVAVLPAASVAVAPSVCEPSATDVVSQVAATLTLDAGGGGVTVAVRLWPSTVRARLAT